MENKQEQKLMNIIYFISGFCAGLVTVIVGKALYTLLLLLIVFVFN